MDKKIQLTDDQYDRLWRDREAFNLMGKVLGRAIKEATELAAEQEQNFWKVVERLADTTMLKNKLSVDWINRQIIVSDHGNEEA